jgi:hypothetical protein
MKILSKVMCTVIDVSGKGKRTAARGIVWLLIGGAVVVVAADPAWRSKPAPEWTDVDARQVLLDSPWAKTVRAKVIPLQTEDQRREGGKLGQDHGVGFDGLADDRIRELPRSVGDLVTPEKTAAPPSQLVTLQLRWESALPIRLAELKSQTVEPPTTETDGYALAVYGIPYAKVKGDPRGLGEPLKKQAVLKREGKQDVRPSSVEVFLRPDGIVIVYLFPASAEIGKSDRQIEFAAQIGRIAVVQVFDVSQMQFQGKLEL